MHSFYFVRVRFHIIYSELVELFSFQFVDLEHFPDRFFRVPVSYLLDSACRKMFFQDQVLNIGNPLLHRGCLRNNVDAVCVIFYHLLQSAHLTLNDFESSNDFSLARIVFMLHNAHHTPHGVSVKTIYN